MKQLTPEEAEALLNKASMAFHNDPDNPSSCTEYMERYGWRCPCENEAEDELNPKQG